MNNSYEILTSSAQENLKNNIMFTEITVTHQ